MSSVGSSLPSGPDPLVCAQCTAALCAHVETIRGEFILRGGERRTTLSLRCRLYLGHPGAHEHGEHDRHPGAMSA